ncbi:hypothetical protein AVEN_13639-1, partial [Araneus ventricosus]
MMVPGLRSMPYQIQPRLPHGAGISYRCSSGLGRCGSRK